MGCQVHRAARSYGAHHSPSPSASVVPALRKGREERGTHIIGSAYKIKSLGHPSNQFFCLASARCEAGPAPLESVLLLILQQFLQMADTNLIVSRVSRGRVMRNTIVRECTNEILEHVPVDF